jgi:hypothetical protein
MRRSTSRFIGISFLLDLYADGATAQVFRGAERGAAAHEWIKDGAPAWTAKGWMELS